MSLKAQYETMDAVPEALRSHYVAKDGKAVLDAEVTDHPDVLALSKSKSDLLAEKRALKKTADEQAERLRVIDDGRAAEDAEKATKAGNVEQVKAQLVTAHEKEMGKATSKVEKLTRSLERVLIENELDRELLPIALNAGAARLLRNELRAQVRMVEDTESGDHHAVVVDAKGNPRLDGKGNPVPVAVLVAEAKTNEEYSAFFKGSQSTGSGAQGSGAQHGSSNGAKSFEQLKAEKAASGGYGRM